MSDEKKNTIDDKIAILMTGTENQTNVLEYKMFLEKVEDIYKQNSYKAYDKFNLSLTKDKDLGWGLIFTGTRNETKEETSAREAIEAAKKKQVQDAELKEYLRLKRKYGKDKE